MREAASISRRACGVEGGEEGALGELEDGVGVEEGVALLGEGAAAPFGLGAGGVEAGEAVGEGEGGVAVGGGVGGGGLGAEAVDAGEAAEGPGLADELGEQEEGEERGQGEGGEAEGAVALDQAGQIVVGGDGDDQRQQAAGDGPDEAAAAAAAGEAGDGLHRRAGRRLVGRRRGVERGRGRGGELVGGDDEGLWARGVGHASRSPIRNSAARSRRMCGRPPPLPRSFGGAKRVTR